MAFAERKGQIARCNAEQLATGLNTTPENLTLTHYLLDQILTMQNDNSNRHNVILYDTLYEYLALDAPNENAKKQEKKKMRDKVKVILDGWVKSGLIESYAELYGLPLQNCTDIKAQKSGINPRAVSLYRDTPKRLMLYMLFTLCKAQRFPSPTLGAPATLSRNHPPNPERTPHPPNLWTY